MQCEQVCLFNIKCSHIYIYIFHNASKTLFNADNETSEGI